MIPFRRHRRQKASRRTCDRQAGSVTPSGLTSLHSVLEELRQDGVLATEERGRGAVPTRYRQLHDVEAGDPEP